MLNGSICQNTLSSHAIKKNLFESCRSTATNGERSKGTGLCIMYGIGDLTEIIFPNKF